MNRSNFISIFSFYIICGEILFDSANSNLSNVHCTTDKTSSAYLEKLEWNSPFLVQCDNAFVGIYREHINDVKSKIVLGNKKSLDINIIPTKKDPTFGTEPTTADLSKLKTIKCKNSKGDEVETAFVHKNGDIKEPMNVTVSVLRHFSVNYDIQVMAVLLGDAGFYQTMRLQCKDLAQETNDREILVRWSCLPLDCNSKIVSCQGPGYRGNQKARAQKCNKYKCCPKSVVPNAWKKDLNYNNVCKNVKC